MDQPSALNFAMDSSAVPTPPEGMSSPTPSSTELTVDSPDMSDEVTANPRQHPIPPASEPMQYRAIGLVHGIYAPSEEQFTRGFLNTDDGIAIDAVLLGRVMSLVKKHVDLEKPHLWVVYPRTREKEYDLHVQIVGIWEPENLSKDDVELPTDEPEPEPEVEEPPAGLVAIPPRPPVPPSVPEVVREPNDGYFSIRGEVLFYSEENNSLIVRIQQTSKKKDKPAKAFKLVLVGKLDGKTVGYFWDLHVQREGNNLVVQESKVIGLVPPRKRKKRPDFGSKRPTKKPWKRSSPGGSRPPGDYSQQGNGPREPQQSGPREMPSRPIKRNNRPPREGQEEQS